MEANPFHHARLAEIFDAIGESDRGDLDLYFAIATQLDAKRRRPRAWHRSIRLPRLASRAAAGRPPRVRQSERRGAVVADEPAVRTSILTRE